MLTLPVAWQVGSSRDTWINTIGTKLMYIRINTAVYGNIRLSNKAGLFAEEGGSEYYYDDRSLNTISEIDQGLSYLNDSAGAVGYLNEFRVIINDGVIDTATNQRFSDMYNLDNLLNCLVDIFLCFEEGSPSAANSLKFRGRIYNYVNKGAQIELLIEEYSQSKQTKLPARVVDLKNLYSTGWNCPDSHLNKIVPINFGHIVGNVAICDLPTTPHKRRVRFAIAYPMDPIVGTNHLLLYWDNENQNAFGVNGSNFVETNNASWYLNTIYIVDIINLPVIARGDIRMTPDAARSMHPSTHGDPEGWKDIDISTAEEGIFGAQPLDVPYIWHNDLTIGYQNIWQLDFLKGSLPEDITFNVYLVMDLVRYGYKSESVKGTFRFYPSNFSGWNVATTTPAMWDLEMDGYSGAEGLGWLSVPKEYAQWMSYKRNIELMEITLKEHGVKIGLPDPFRINIQVKQDDASSYSHNYQGHEIYMFIMPVTPLVRYFAQGDFGWSGVHEAMGMVFDYFIGLASTNYLTFVNFARNYDIDGQVMEEMNSYSLLAKIALQFGMIIHEGIDGVTRVVDLNGKAVDYTLDDDDILQGPDNVLDLSFSKHPAEVYSKYSIDYNYNIPLGKYNSTRYINPNNHNLTYVSATELQLLCNQAKTTYGSEKELVIQCDLVGEDLVAEEILQKLVKLFTSRINVVNFRTSLRNVDLQLGDQVAFDTSYFTDSTNYFVCKKRINWEAGTIDYEAFRSPFGGTAKEGDMASDAAISEKVAINEYIDYYLGAVP